jgi:hypothetical protein
MRIPFRLPAITTADTPSSAPDPGRRQVIGMAATITFTYPFSPDDIALLNKLLGTSAAAGKPAAAAAATQPAAEYFPADPALAKFPSPEDSQILVFNGGIKGRPYLKDQA